jgi:hypothetical protein
LTESEFYMALVERRVRVIEHGPQQTEIRIFRDPVDCLDFGGGRIPNRDWISIVPKFYIFDRSGYDQCGQIVYLLTDSNSEIALAAISTTLRSLEGPGSHCKPSAGSQPAFGGLVLAPGLSLAQDRPRGPG